MIENFVCFYSSCPFWAGQPINLEDPENLKNLRELITEVVFRYESDAFRLWVCRDGMLMLQIYELEAAKPDEEGDELVNWIAWWEQYLNHFNCLYLLLDACLIEVLKLGYIKLSEVTNKDVFRLRVVDGKILGCETFATESITSVFQLDRFYSSVFPQNTQFNVRLITRRAFPKEVFDKLAAKFSVVLTHKELVSRLSVIAKSISEYKVGNFPISLILSWFIIELVVTEKWERFLDSKNQAYEDGSKRISADRRKILTGLISAISNILELADSIQYELFKKIDAVRGYRNKVIHKDSGYVCQPEHCRLALETALDLTLEGHPLQVTLNMGYSVPGP